MKMPLISEIRIAAILGLVAIAQPAGAQDAGLYDKPIDPNTQKL